MLTLTGRCLDSTTRTANNGRTYVDVYVKAVTGSVVQCYADVADLGGNLPSPGDELVATVTPFASQRQGGAQLSIRVDDWEPAEAPAPRARRAA